MSIATISRFLILFAVVAGALLILGLNHAGAASLNSICSDTGATAGSNVGSSAFCKDHSTTNPILSNGGVLNKVTNIITAIAAFVAVVMIVVSGFQLITSSGNPEKISNARNVIIYASIGLIVVVLARIIIVFVLKKVS